MTVYRGTRRGTGCGFYVMSWLGPLLFIGWPWAFLHGTAALAVFAVWMCAAVPVLLVLHGRRRRRLRQARPAPPVPGLPRPRVPLPAETRRYVWVRDGGRCRSCRISDADSMAMTGEHLQYDHIIPRALGGTDAKENIQLLCPPENRAKGARLYWRAR
jgi:hypothetical protein